MNENECSTNDGCRFGEIVNFDIRGTGDGGQFERPADFDVCANGVEPVSGTGEAEEEVEEESREDHVEAPEQDPGDVRRMKRIIDPCLPTRAEIEEHRLTHLPFRNWCPFCQGPLNQHF